MKHLLNGVAFTALIALATPVFAQNAPMTPSSPPAAQPAAKAPAAPAAPTAKAPAVTKTAAKPMMTKPMHHMAVHHMAMRHMGMHHRMMDSGDQMTEQLNQQELQRLQTGGAPMQPAGQMQGKSPAPGTSAPPPPAR